METEKASIKKQLKQIGIKVFRVEKSLDWHRGQRYIACSFFKKYLVYTKNENICAVHQIKNGKKKIVWGNTEQYL